MKKPYRPTYEKIPRELSPEACQEILVLLSRSRADSLGRPRCPSHPTLEWGRRYLPQHFVKPASPMHQWLGAQLDGFQRARGLKVNVIGPRGAAKSTIATLGYVLQAAVAGWERYIWIVSDTKQQAQTHLENVKAELVDNRDLRGDYPRATGRGPRWQATSIELESGVVIESFGTGQRIRGRRRRANRPTLIVCDDLQNDSHISSAAQRESSRRWFHGTLLKAGTPRTNIINLATALHRDALAMELLTAAGWNSQRFAAILSWPTNLELWHEWEKIYTKPMPNDGMPNDRMTNDGSFNSSFDIRSSSLAARAFFDARKEAMLAGAVVLWPEVEDLYTLMKMRVESGHAAFEREKQGSPVDPELCEWPEDYFGDHIWFESWAKVESQESRAESREQEKVSGSRHLTLDSRLVIKTMALDPSKGGDARRGDYSAYVMLGIDAAGVVYVEADLARRATPQMVADGVAWHARFRPLSFGVEANQY